MVSVRRCCSTTSATPSMRAICRRPACSCAYRRTRDNRLEAPAIIHAATHPVTFNGDGTFLGAAKVCEKGGIALGVICSVWKMMAGVCGWLAAATVITFYSEKRKLSTLNGAPTITWRRV